MPWRAGVVADESSRLGRFTMLGIREFMLPAVPRFPRQRKSLSTPNRLPFSADCGMRIPRILRAWPKIATGNFRQVCNPKRERGRMIATLGIQKCVKHSPLLTLRVIDWKHPHEVAWSSRSSIKREAAEKVRRAFTWQERLR